MGDVLKYRFPGSKPISKFGHFSQLDSFSNFSGFIVSTFDKSKRFGFIESNSSPEFHYSSSKPDCYSKEEYLRKGVKLVGKLQSCQELCAVYVCRTGRMGR